ncbi:hypothetical protein X915_gp181 [Bacillus phage vB_BanS-Tsamsa]|uniref:Uncharacterized protein n=1 Tax=Bacillus phage vB_BanS-Tsamsa TaxID=1308863 RepID=U5J9X9_9CAUD|nr:hypothetical protein X915_gp181 [Bacillus phage vB_BanS-Tsamsa]AGI11835.1 hypothetical protein [Bacillus phage vB_BanS-Tsamsa]
MNYREIVIVYSGKYYEGNVARGELLQKIQDELKAEGRKMTGLFFGGSYTTTLNYDSAKVVVFPLGTAFSGLRISELYFSDSIYKRDDYQEHIDHFLEMIVPETYIPQVYGLTTPKESRIYEFNFIDKKINIKQYKHKGE